MEEWEKQLDGMEEGLFKASEALKGGQGSPILRAVEDWVSKRNKQLHKNLDKGKHNATSKLYQAAQFHVDQKGSIISISLEMPKYGEYLDEGTRPGPRRGLYGNLLTWAKMKMGGSGTGPNNNYKTLAYFVAKKIEREGTKPTHWFSSVYNEDSINRLKGHLAEAGASILLNAFK